MRRYLLGVVLALSVATGVAAQGAIVRYFAAYSDETLPAPPCVTFEPVSVAPFAGQMFVFYTCVDGRTIARQFQTQIEQPTTPGPMVSCPSSGHRACSCLPAASYPADWIETVGCGR